MTHVACWIATANLPIAGHMQHIALSDMATGGDKSQIVKYTRGDGVVDGGRNLCGGGGTRPERASERDEGHGHRVVVNNPGLYLPEGLLRGRFSAYGRVVAGRLAVVMWGGGVGGRELGRIGSITQHNKIGPAQRISLRIYMVLGV